MLRSFLPLALIACLLAFLAFGLTRDPSSLPSELMDGPFPDFELQTLGGDNVSRDDLVGEVSLVNVFGSWCTACLVEHPLLMELQGDIRIIGVNWRDDRQSAVRWLERHGDPYELIVFDPESRLAIDLGVYGAPETFIVDRQGVIRFKHSGPITRDDWTSTLAPLINSLHDEMTGPETD